MWLAYNEISEKPFDVATIQNDGAWYSSHFILCLAQSICAGRCAERVQKRRGQQKERSRERSAMEGEPGEKGSAGERGAVIGGETS